MSVGESCNNSKIVDSDDMNKQAGFSLLELLIVSALLAIIFISVSSLMMSLLSGSIKTSLWQELRTEGTFGMTQMTYLLRNSPELLYEDMAVNSCNNLPQSYIQFDNADDTKSMLMVDAQNQLNLITINDNQSFQFTANSTVVPIFSTSVQLKEPAIFTCSKTAEQPYVKITFTLVKNSETFGDLTQDFRRTVILRN